MPFAGKTSELLTLSRKSTFHLFPCIESWSMGRLACPYTLLFPLSVSHSHIDCAHIMSIMS